MSRSDAVKKAILHEESDYIPYNIELTREVEARLETEMGLKAGGFFEWAGNHIEKCGFETGETIRPGFYKDEYGVVWDRSGQDKDIGIMAGVIFPEPEIDLYAFPSVDRAGIEAKCQKFLAVERDTYKFAKIGTTLFERAWSLRGFENLFMDFMLEESFSHALLERIADRNIEILDVVLRYDFDGVYFGDDYGQQTSLLMSPDTWRKFIKPQLKRMFDLIKSKGKSVCLHSCGNIYAILGDLIDIGLDVYQTVQPEIYDLQSLNKEFGSSLAFYGAISTQRDLPYKDAGEIKSIVKETMRVLGSGGGYIAAPTHRITGDVPVDNILAMIDAFKNQQGRMT